MAAAAQPDGASSNCTLDQNGAASGLKAYAFNGTTSYVRIANDASINALTKYSQYMILNPTDAGEGGAGVLTEWGDTISAWRFNAALTSLTNREDTDANDALFITSSGLSASTWAILFMILISQGIRKSTCIP
jgi:hypothetical protein